MKREQAKKRDTVDYETKEESIVFFKTCNRNSYGNY